MSMATGQVMKVISCIVPTEHISHESASHSKGSGSIAPPLHLLMSTSIFEAGEKLDTVTDVLSVDPAPSLSGAVARTATIEPRQQEEVYGVNLEEEVSKHSRPCHSGASHHW